MPEENKGTWITWLALTTAFLAVFAAVTTMYMGKFANRAILIQGQETNHWGYNQAKSIKRHTYEIQKQKLELDFVVTGEDARCSGRTIKKCHGGLRSQYHPL